MLKKQTKKKKTEKALPPCYSDWMITQFNNEGIKYSQPIVIAS